MRMDLWQLLAVSGFVLAMPAVSTELSTTDRVDLTFSPGSGYAYSNGGYAVLAAVIEVSLRNRLEPSRSKSLAIPLAKRQLDRFEW